jgi:hypothetical protein
VLGIAISSDGEVVVAAGVTFSAVAGQVRDSPGLRRRDENRVGTRGDRCAGS